MEFNTRILSGLLVPVFLLAVWLCPCSNAHKPAKGETAAAHKCCEAKQTPSKDKSKPERDCPHCNGANANATAEQNKVAAYKVNLHKLVPTLVYDPLYLTRFACADRCTHLEECVPIPDIPLQTCTFRC